MAIRRFTGHRGTSKAKAHRCIKSGKYDKSTRDDEYFGHGIYFFENDPYEAYCWAKFNRSIPEPEISVIEAEIKVNSENVLDLVMREYYEEYIRIISAMAERLTIKPEYPLDCSVINMICDHDGFEVVRGVFPPNHTLFRELEGYSRIPRTHIQLAVRNCKLITKSKEHNLNFNKKNLLSKVKRHEKV